MKNEIISMKELSKNFKITKSNKLIEANYNLTLNEQRIILSAVSKIQPLMKQTEGIVPNIIQFDVNNLKNLLEIKNDKFLQEIKNIAKKLGSKSLYIQEINSDEFINIQWLSSSQYIKNKNVLEIEFSSKMMPYLIDLANNFTTYQLESILKFKCAYSIRIFELLKQFQNTQVKESGYKERIFDLCKLKQLLEVEVGAYATYSNFKMRILKPACVEINKYTELDVDFLEIKKGKKVDKIKFIFNLKKSKYIENKKNNFESDIDDVIAKTKIETIQNIIDEKISFDDAKSLYNVAKGDVGLVIQKYFLSKGKNINNIIGYLIKSIEQDYDDVTTIKKHDDNFYKNRFHNFKQRTDNYSEEELEEVARLNRESALAALNNRK